MDVLKKYMHLPLGTFLQVVKDVFIFATNESINSCVHVPDLNEVIKACEVQIKLKEDDINTIKTLKDMINIAEKLVPIVEEIREAAPHYDFSPTQKGNGYRSFLSIQQTYSALLCDIINKESHNINSLSDAKRLLAALLMCFEHLQQIKTLSADGSLYPTGGIGLEEILDFSEKMDAEIFYGRFIAEQFSGPLKFVLKELSKIITIYSEWYYGTPLWWIPCRIFNYMTNNTKRARRHVAISLHGGIDFIKTFWSNSECFLLNITMEATNPVEVSTEIIFEKSSVLVDGVEIKPFCRHSAVVRGRLISKRLRKGMPGAGEDAEEPSPGLIIHAHGGGFISQSAKSQEIFLRKWAESLDVPILSIDYPLAPDAAFPSQPHALFYAYCVALAEAAKLGSTCKRVVLVGDSAGANLILAATQECIHKKIRIPDGLFLAYVPSLVAFVPSPSRLLGLLDPLLTFGVMMRCARAYACGENPASSPSQKSCDCAECKSTTQLTFLDDPHLPHPTEAFTFTVPSHPYMSPILADDTVFQQMPPISFSTSTFDPCLDDTIMMAKKLKNLGKKVTIDIFENLPHGFLNFCWVSKEATDALKVCDERIRNLLALSEI